MLLLTAAVGAGLYGFTLGFPFQFDDQVYVAQNPLIMDWKMFRLWPQFSEVYRVVHEHGLPEDVATNFILRPFTYLTFALNYAVGGLDPKGYRLVNILIHCANGLLLFQLLRFFLSRAGTPNRETSGSATFIPATAALLFLVHPMQVESVTYIVQRSASLGTFFYLLTLWFYFTAETAQTRRAQTGRRVASLLTLLLGMLSKEEVFTAPIMIVLLDVLVMRSPWKRTLGRALPHLACMEVLPCLVMMIPICLSGHATLQKAMGVACPLGGGYQWSYALTETRVVVKYLGLLLVPNRLHVDWNFPRSTSVGDWRIWASLATVVAMLGVAWFFHGKRGEDKRHALLWAGFLWYFVTIAVSSSIVPLPDVMAEHRAYLPSVGVMVILACYADMLRRLFADRRPAWAVPMTVGLWVVMLCYATILRNTVWKSCTSLWADAISQSPDNYRAWGNWGGACAREGRVADAIVGLTSALSLKRDYADGYQNLAVVLLGTQKFQETVRICDEGLRRCGSREALFYIKSQACLALGQRENAENFLHRTLAISPKHFDAHLCLAKCYAEDGQLSKAQQHYEKAAALHPEDHRLAETRKLLQAKCLSGRKS